MNTANTDIQPTAQKRIAADARALERKLERKEVNTPRITQVRHVFSMVCRVEVSILAEAQRVWDLLIDARDFPRWNSTVTRIEGEIKDGERLRLHVPGTDRTFTPRVCDLVPGKRMVWTGGFAPLFKGVRTFELRARGAGSTEFAMEERFSGPVFALGKGSLPDFGPVFERFANDLKREAERSKP